MKSKTLSLKKKELFMPYNNSLLEFWADDNIQNLTTSLTPSSWDVYPIFFIAENSSMAVNFQSSKDLL